MYAPYCMYVGKGDSDKTTLVLSLLWVLYGHLCSKSLCIWARKILTTLHLCTVSSEHSLVTYAQSVCVCEQGRFWRHCTCAEPPLGLLWSLMLNIFCVCEQGRLTRIHLYTVSLLMQNIFVYASQCDSDETALVHSLVWAFAGHLCFFFFVYVTGRLWLDYTCAEPILTFAGHIGSIFLWMWAGKILKRWHMCTDSSESSLVTGRYCLFVLAFLCSPMGKVLKLRTESNASMKTSKTTVAFTKPRSYKTWVHSQTQNKAQPINALNFEFETVLKFYNIEARTCWFVRLCVYVYFVCVCVGGGS